MSSLHHGGLFRVVRGAGDVLELLTLKKTGLAMTWEQETLNADLCKHHSVVV